jgi:HEAT repeat protein
MISLPEVDDQAIKIVSQALNVDIFLGSQLAGSIKPELLKNTAIELIEGQTEQDWLKANLLGMTQSDIAVPYLEKMLQHEDSVVRWHVVYALWLVHHKTVIPLLINALGDKKDLHISMIAENALEDISESKSAYLLISILRNEGQPPKIREKANTLLLDTSSEKTFDFLKGIAENSDLEIGLRRIAAHDIAKTDKELALNLIHNILDNCINPKDILNIIGLDLSEIRSDKSVEPLLDILRNNENITLRCTAAVTLGKIGSQKAVDSLLEILKIRADISAPHEKTKLNSNESKVCSNVAYALRGYASQELFEISLKILKKPWEDVDVRSQTLNILCNKGDQETIEELKNIIFNGSEDQTLRIDAIQALRFLDDWIPNIARRILDFQLPENLILKHKVIDILQELDKDESIALLSDLLRSSENSGLKSHAALTLHKYSDREDILSLLKKALKNSHQEVRKRATEALGKPENENAVIQLLELLEGGDSSDRQSAICALGSIGSKKAYAELLRVFQDNDEDLSIRNLAIWALTQIDICRTLDLLTEHLEHIQDRDLLKELIITLGKSSEPNAVEPLLQLLSKNNEDSMIQNYTLHALGQVATPDRIPTLINLSPMMSDGMIAAIIAIQSRCGFYNYNIAQSPPPEISIEMQQGGNQYIFPNAKEVQIIEHIDNYKDNHNP